MRAKIGGKSYELAKDDKALMRELARVRDTTDAVDAIDLQWAFLVRAIGADATREAAGGESPNDCSASSLQVAFQAVCDAYAAPVERAQADRMARQLSALDVDKLARVMEAARDMQGRQGFRLVR